jgi:CRISPR-associated protein Csm3
MVYNVETRNAGEVRKDLSNTLDVMGLLEDDYLGGHGSRGYGRIKFRMAPDGFSCRSMAYYGARSEEEKANGLCAPEVTSLFQCQSLVDQVLGILK